MKSTIPGPQSGDLCLLFHHLPYEYDEQLPIQLTQSVCLDETPFTFLENTKQGVADFLIPGYSLNIGVNHCCLRTYVDGSNRNLKKDNASFFLGLQALRLFRPLHIECAGCFEFGYENDKDTELARYCLVTPWHPRSSSGFSGKDVYKASQISDRIIEVQTIGLQRLTTALVLFGQVTIGMTKSYQLGTLGLFASLEALFHPKKNKADALSSRVAKFLTSFDFGRPIDRWLKDHYIRVRSNISHGIDDVAPNSKLKPEKYNAFSCLHEICRLSLLGFMSLEDNYLSKLYSESGPKLQRELDNLPVSEGKLISKQQCYATINNQE